MPAPADYSATGRMRDGRDIEIRALRPDDKDDMLAAVGRTGSESLRRRFFTLKRGFSEKEIAFFVNIDFANHVALIALADEDGRKCIIGGRRYVVVEPGKAEIAFVVIDDYQGQGVGTLLMRHLDVIARKAGLRELIAEVLPENMAMRKVFDKVRFPTRLRTGAAVGTSRDEAGLTPRDAQHTQTEGTKSNTQKAGISGPFSSLLGSLAECGNGWLTTKGSNSHIPD